MSLPLEWTVGSRGNGQPETKAPGFFWSLFLRYFVVFPARTAAKGLARPTFPLCPGHRSAHTRVSSLPLEWAARSENVALPFFRRRRSTALPSFLCVLRSLLFKKFAFIRVMGRVPSCKKRLRSFAATIRVIRVICGSTQIKALLPKSRAEADRSRPKNEFNR